MIRRHLSALLVLAACGGASTDEGTGGPSDEPRSSGSTDPVTATDGEPTVPRSARMAVPEVEVLEPGEGERARLRRSAEVGQTARLRLELVVTMEVQAGAQQVPEVEMPKVRLDFELRTADVGDDGAMRHESRVVALEVLGEGPVVPRLEQDLAPLRDLTGWDVIDPRGRLVASRYDLPASASPELRNSLQRVLDALRQMMPAFPEEPVAVGAKWRASSDVRSPVAFRQVSTYTLEAMEEGRTVLSVQTDQSADPQPMASDQPGVTAELLAFDGECSFHLELALDELAPTAEGQMAVEMTTRATKDGDAHEVTMKMDTAVTASAL